MIDGIAKTLLAIPALALVAAPVAHPNDVLMWAMLGACLGGYVAAGYELLMAMTAAQATGSKTKQWIAFAALRMTVSFPFGLMLSLNIAARMEDAHPWNVGSIAFVGALLGLAAKPLMDRLLAKKFAQLAAAETNQIQGGK